MLKPIILQPAYGNKYKNCQEAEDAYLAGKDFKLMGGPYCSCRDFKDQEVSLYLGNGLYHIVRA